MFCSTSDVWTPCPCATCNYTNKPPRTVKRHTEDIASGKRDRAGAQDAEVNNDDELESSDSESAEEVLPVDIQVAKELRDTVARGLVSSAGVEAITKVFFKHYSRYLPDDVGMPSSWYKVQTLAGIDQEAPAYCMRHFCPHCDCLYPEDLTVVVCPRATCQQADRFDSTKRPRRVAFYFDLEDKVQRMFSKKYIAREFSYASTREAEDVSLNLRELRDIWDGSILHNLADVMNEDTLVLQQSNDGVEVQKNLSYTPVVFKFLNLPPSIRSRFGCLALVAFFPPRVKSYQDMLLPLVLNVAKFQPGRETITVFDAYQKEERHISLIVAPLINDIRALPYCTCGKHPPCYVGSCNHCVQGGVWHRRVTLPGLCRALPMNSPVRELWNDEFGEVPGMEDWSTKGRPAKRTREGALKAGQLVQSGEREKTDEAYYAEDIYSLNLEYHDKINHNLYDLAHNFSNAIKQSLNYIKNKNKDDKNLFNDAMRDYEKSLGRFTDDWYTSTLVIMMCI